MLEDTTADLHCTGVQSILPTEKEAGKKMEEEGNTQSGGHMVEASIISCWPGCSPMMEETTSNSPIKGAVAHKEAGNALFESKRYAEAAQEYLLGLSIITEGCTASCCKDAKKYLFTSPPTPIKVFNAIKQRLKIICELNLAACGIKLEDYNMTLKHCQQILNEPNLKEEFPCLYLKALFRKGQMLRLSGDYKVYLHYDFF